MTTTTTITAPTDQDIAAAEKELAASEVAVAAARKFFSRGDNHGAAQLRDANGRYKAAAAALVDLRAQQERAEKIEARRKLEKAAAKDLKVRADDLANSRDRVVTALTAAQDALAVALDAVTEHGATLADHAGELAAAGFLGIGDEFTAGADPRNRVVVLGEQYWREVDPNIVLAQLVERVRTARLDPEGFEIAVRRFARGHMKNATAAAVLADVPKPKLASAPPPRMPAWGRPLIDSDTR